MWLVILFMLPFVPPHLFRWEVLFIIVSVLTISFLFISLFCRVAYGHWPR